MEYLQISPDIHIFNYSNGGVIYNEKTKREYTLGIEELYILKKINENRITKAEDLNCDIPLQKIQLVIEKYKELGILCQEDTSIEIKKKQQFCIGLNLLRDTKFNKQIEQFPFKIVSNMILFLPIILLLVLLVISANRSMTISMQDLLDKKYLISTILSFIFCLFIPTVGHELSHAIVAKRYHCHVVEVGMILRGIFLCFYVRIVGLGMNTRKERIAIYLAGMLFNISSLLLALIVGQLLSKHIIIKNLMLLCIFSNAEMIISNSLCIFHLDGHKVLQELLNKWSLIKCFHELSLKEKLFIGFGTSIYLVALIVSLIFNIVWLPLIAHIIIAISIFCLFRYERRCMAYCFFILSYGIIGSLVLLIYQMINYMAYPWISCIFFLSITNVCLVWFGTLFYLINEKCLKMKLFSKGVL